MKAKEREELLTALKARFEKNMGRHQGLEWAKVRARLEANPEKLRSLKEMERTGGEPDVVGYDEKTGEYIRDNQKRIDCCQPRLITRRGRTRKATFFRFLVSGLYYCEG